MKNLYLLTFLLFCCSIANSFSQADTTIISPTIVTPKDYTLSVEGDELIFTSEVPDGQARLAIGGDDITLDFQGEGRPPLSIPTPKAGSCSSRTACNTNSIIMPSSVRVVTGCGRSPCGCLLYRPWWPSHWP